MKCKYCGNLKYQRFLIDGELVWLCRECTDEQLDRMREDLE